MTRDQTDSPTTPIARDAYEQLADAYAARIDTKPHNAYLERPATLGLLPYVAGNRVLVGEGHSPTSHKTPPTTGQSAIQRRFSPQISGEVARVYAG